MEAVGLVVGHGNTKVCSAGKTVAFRSQVARLNDMQFEDQVSASVESVLVAGDRWLVGDDVERFAPGRSISMLDRTRYRDCSFQALACHALRAAVHAKARELLIYTGMPAAWYADQAARADLRAAIRAAASDWPHVEVEIAPEAAGLFYAYVFERNMLDAMRTQGQIGVIDVGYRDANIALFADGKYVSGSSVPVGMATAMVDVQRDLSRMYGMELSLHACDQAVRRGSIMVDGVEQHLPDQIRASLQQGLHPLVAQARSVWPNGGRSLERIVLGGGGAVALGGALFDVFPQCHVPFASVTARTNRDALPALIAQTNPHCTPAWGFAQIARATLERRS